MANYRVELGYTTKRGGVCLGMTLDAFGPDEAEEYARRKYLDPFPARKFAFCKISEATPAEIACGVERVEGNPMRGIEVCKTLIGAYGYYVKIDGITELTHTLLVRRFRSEAAARKWAEKEVIRRESPLRIPPKPPYGHSR